MSVNEGGCPFPCPGVKGCFFAVRVGVRKLRTFPQLLGVSFYSFPKGSHKNVFLAEMSAMVKLPTTPFVWKWEKCNFFMPIFYLEMNSPAKNIQNYTNQYPLEKSVNMRIVCARYARAQYFPIFFKLINFNTFLNFRRKIY